MSNKIKLLYFSDFGLAKTGFGRASRNLLEYLYKTGKYEISHACMMSAENSPELEATPWRSLGTIPSNEQFQRAYQQDERLRVSAGYGFYKIDEIVKNSKCDILLANQDIWGIEFLTKKSYWNKFPCILWTTLDSLPIHPKAIEASQKCAPGNFWVWSNFAEKDMKKNGFNNVRTVCAPFESNEFFRLEKVKRQALRKKFNIDGNAFGVIMVSRNQLRKSFYCLLEGYSMFKKDNPTAKAFVLLHTNFSEGWDIMQLAKDYGIPPEEILTTYICDKCDEYEVKPFKGEGLDCHFCSSQKSQHTTSPRKGVSNAQLNEVYNLADVYCHPFTSGGLEVTASCESKFAELPVLATNYSCGEEICEDGSGSLVLDYTAYRDLTQSSFIKAATIPKSVSKQLSKVFRMTEAERRVLGRQGREWAVKKYSIENAASKIDEILCNLPPTDYNFIFDSRKPNPEAVISDIEDDTEWLKTMYRDILAMEVDKNDNGLKNWLEKLKKVD